MGDGSGDPSNATVLAICKLCRENMGDEDDNDDITLTIAEDDPKL